MKIEASQEPSPQKGKRCQECGNSIGQSRRKFCSRKCQNNFNTRKRNREKSKVVYLSCCKKCGKSIERPKRSFCSQGCKNQYNHKHKYGYKYKVAHRSRNPRNYLKALLEHHKRKESLSLEYLLKLYDSQKGLCALSGEAMTHQTGKGKLKTNMSIDKIVPARGYVEGNVQLVCTIVNIMKHTMSLKELKGWCEKILST